MIWFHQIRNKKKRLIEKTLLLQTLKEIELNHKWYRQNPRPNLKRIVLLEIKFIQKKINLILNQEKGLFWKIKVLNNFRLAQNHLSLIRSWVRNLILFKTKITIEVLKRVHRHKKIIKARLWLKSSQLGKWTTIFEYYLVWKSTGLETKFGNKSYCYKL